MVFAKLLRLSHLKGCKFVSKLAGVKSRLADIVITTNGGYPLDQNIYQSVKGMAAAEATCKKGGVIIIASACDDGHGGDFLHNTFAKADIVQNVMDEIMARNRDETIPDQWESQVLARILLKNKVIMVTNASKEIVENMHMEWAANVGEAIEIADEMLGNRSKITVIPDGVSVIVR